MSNKHTDAFDESAKKLSQSLAELQQQPLPEETMQALRNFENELKNFVETGAGKPQADLIEEKARFVSLVSHELRVPLTSIKGYTDIILKGMVGSINDQQREFLEIVERNVERMGTLIADIRDITRLESGRTQLVIESVELSQCVQAGISKVQGLIDAGNHHIHVHLPENLTPVSADNGRLIQVLKNILQNAAMYAAPGANITITAAQENGFVRLAVTDTGYGISDEDQARVFEPFFRSDEANIREHQGWGLGLSVAQHLIQAMRGDIGMESEIKKGSTFWFSLPIAQS